MPIVGRARSVRDSQATNSLNHNPAVRIDSSVVLRRWPKQRPGNFSARGYRYRDLDLVQVEAGVQWSAKAAVAGLRLTRSNRVRIPVRVPPFEVGIFNSNQAHDWHH